MSLSISDDYQTYVTQMKMIVFLFEGTMSHGNRMIHQHLRRGGVVCLHSTSRKNSTLRKFSLHFVYTLTAAWIF